MLCVHRSIDVKVEEPSYQDIPVSVLSSITRTAADQWITVATRVTTLQRDAAVTRDTWLSHCQDTGDVAIVLQSACSDTAAKETTLVDMTRYI